MHFMIMLKFKKKKKRPLLGVMRKDALCQNSAKKNTSEYIMYVISFQDKVIFYRLEHVCHTVEKGEWPSVRRYAIQKDDNMSDSRCSTPAPSTPGGATPRPDEYLSTPEGGNTPQVKYFDSEADDGDSLLAALQVWWCKLVLASSVSTTAAQG